MSEDIELVLVRRDSDNKVEIVKKESFDPTGYSFLTYTGTKPAVMEEWVETDRLEDYQSLKKE